MSQQLLVQAQLIQQVSAGALLSKEDILWLCGMSSDCRMECIAAPHPRHWIPRTSVLLQTTRRQ